jgi:hypothetical protein
VGDVIAPAPGTIGAEVVATLGKFRTDCCAMIPFAASVASHAHDGHETAAGIFPPTGSISNANFVPHSQRILMVMFGLGLDG